jgi:hypothetical protein
LEAQIPTRTEALRKRLAADPEYAKAMLGKAATSVVQAAIEGAIAHGNVDVVGKSEAEVRQALVDLFADEQKRIRFLFAIDHTPTLRRLGRKFESEAGACLGFVDTFS